jgi:NAD(P)-dependent dehydrogenase (short-subunit alcohol dehydrogenase family)
MSSVLVTGASRGIGFATALALGRAGHTVYATMRDPGRAPDLAETAEQPTRPSVVAEKILEIIGNGEWRLRYPVGPEAEGYLQRRASMTDEQWIERGAADDETWSRSIERTFGRKLSSG